MKRIVLTLCVFIALSSLANAARHYKCVDSNGNILLTDKPPQDARCESMGGERDKTAGEREMEQQQIESERASRAEQALQAGRTRQAERARRAPCEIVSFSQYERNSGGGIVTGGQVIPGSGGIVTGGVVVGGHKDTCVDLTIRNNDSVERTVTNAGIVAVTKKGNSRSPKGFMTIIQPGGMYQGTACFGVYMSTITKLECKF